MTRFPVSPSEFEELCALPSRVGGLPWHLHRSGSELAIKDKRGVVILKKCVSGMGSRAAYMVLLRDFVFIVGCVNAAGSQLSTLNPQPSAE